MSRIFAAILLLFSIGLAGQSRLAEAAGYYNIGAFWRAPASVVCNGSNGVYSAITLAQAWQKSGPTSSTTVSVNLASSATVGNVLIAATAVRANQTMSVSDNQGNVWSPLGEFVNTQGTQVTAIELFYAPVTNANTTQVTVATPVAARMVLNVAEYSGLPSTGGYTTSNGLIAASSTANMVAPSVTATGDVSLVIGFFADAKGGATAMTADAAYNSELAVQATTYLTLVEDQLAAAAGAYAPPATNSNTDNWWAAASAVFGAKCTTLASMTPTLTSISTQGGPIAGGGTLTITGNYFDSGATVKIGGNDCPVTGRTGMTQLQCTIPAGSAGFRDVVVTDSNNHTGALTSAYLYGTVGTQQWLGGKATSWGWQTYNASAPADFLGMGEMLTDAGFNNPTKILYGATGGTGYLYVVDFNAGRVTKFNASTGAEVGWIGGVGTVPTGDPLTLGCTSAIPGQATPGWCLGGSSGMGNDRSRLYDGSLQGAMGAAIDPTGATLYVTSDYYHHIEKFDAATGAFQGWIGWGDNTGGSAGCPSGFGPTTGWCSGGVTNDTDTVTNEGGFDGPSDVAIDPSGTYLYAMDRGNGRVEQFNASTGAYIGWLGTVNSATGLACASTNAGCTLGGANAFSGGFVTGGTPKNSSSSGGFNTNADQMIAVDANYLYVVDPTLNWVQRFNLPSGTFAGWLGWVATSNGSNCTTTGAFSGKWCNAGGTAAGGYTTGHLRYPSGVAVDSTYIYIANQDNGAITRVKLDGTSPAWIGAIGSSGPFVGAWSTTGSSDNFDSDLAGDMSTPVSVTLDSTNDKLFVLDLNHHRINRYALSTGAFEKYLANPPAVSTGWNTSGAAIGGRQDGMFSLYYQATNMLTLDPANTTLYVTDVGASRVMKFDVATGAFQGWLGGVGFTPSGGASGCTSLLEQQVTPGWCTGGSGETSNNAGAFSIDTPTGVAVDPTNQYLYVADAYLSRITRFKVSDGSPQGFIGYVISGGTGCASSTGPTNGWCTGTQAQTGQHAGSDTALDYPMGLAMDPAGGYFYVADQDRFRVARFDLAGVFQGWIGYGTNTGGGAGCPSSSGGVTTGWCTGGTSAPASSSAAGGFGQPDLLVVDGSGYLWVYDLLRNRVQKFNASTGAYVGAVTLLSKNTDGSSAFGIDQSGNSLFTIETPGYRLAFGRYAAATGNPFGFLGDYYYGPGTSGQTGCTSVAVGSSPNLWCNVSPDSDLWLGQTLFNGTDLLTPIVVDSAGHYLYFFDSHNARLTRMSIDN